MNNRSSIFSPILATLLVGFLFWSWGGAAGWRTITGAMTPYPNFSAFQKKLPPAQQKAKSQQSRMELSNRLSEVVKDPAKISKSDLAEVKAAWGQDAARMLSILKDSSR